MNKLITFCTIFVIVLLIVIPVSLTFLIKIIPGGVQSPLGNTKKVYGGSTLAQTFISPGDNLTGIGVSIKNPNFANKKNALVKISDENNQILRTVNLNGQNIADGKFVKILFDPIAGSINKKFTWSISSEESTFDDALEIFLTNKQPSWSTEFKVNDKVAPDGLSYVTLHRSGSSAEVLKKVLGNWLYKFTQDQAFSIFYLVLILFLTGGIIFSKFGSYYWKK